VLTRILHVSDLHFGARDDPVLERALAGLIERAGPELVIASGDLTHRGRRDQHERAAAFLRRLELPVLAIPGNHDIPYTFPGRFTRSFRAFEQQWETTEPTYTSPTLHVVGLNSVRPWRHQSGGLRATGFFRERHGAPIRWWCSVTTLSAPAGACSSSSAARLSWPARTPPDWCRHGRTELRPTTKSSSER